MFFFYVGKVQY